MKRCIPSRSAKQLLRIRDRAAHLFTQAHERQYLEPKLDYPSR